MTGNYRLSKIDSCCRVGPPVVAMLLGQIAADVARLRIMVAVHLIWVCFALGSAPSIPTRKPPNSAEAARYPSPLANPHRPR